MKNCSIKRRMSGGGVFGGSVCVFAAIHGFSTAANASVTNSWINWTPPSSYGSTGSVGSTSYSYATGTTGSITMPDSSTVGITFSGEIVAPVPYAGWNPAWGTPSGFTSVAGTTTPDYWTTQAAVDASTYTSANASPPTNGDHIGLIGGTNGLVTQTITFDSPVTNILMTIYSLGSPSTLASWDFNQNFDILSDNQGVVAGGLTGSGLTKTLTGGNYRLSGTEGAGTIQFFGTFTTLSWTVSAPEIYAAWNIGVTSAIAPSAVPGAGLAGLAGLASLGLAGLARRRRR